MKRIFILKEENFKDFQKSFKKMEKGIFLVSFIDIEDLEGLSFSLFSGALCHSKYQKVDSKNWKILLEKNYADFDEEGTYISDDMGSFLED